jgi:glutamine synthetase
VIFNGNGYSDEWVREAERRGLPNVKNAVDALAVLVQSETISLFETHKVLTKEELESRYHIYLEKYAKQINIEAGVAIDLSRRYLFPAVTAYAGSLAGNASALASVGAPNIPQAKQAKRIAELSAELYDETTKLENVLAEVQAMEDILTQAKAYFEKVLPAVDKVRIPGDALEKLVSKEAWPFPGYEELLFKL